MKKYLLGIFVALIGIGLSAFVHYEPPKSQTKKMSFENAYYWYELRADGKIAGGVLNGGATDVKSNVMVNGSNPLTPCDDFTLPYCLAGCSSPSLHAGDIPDAPSGDFDNRIKKNN